MKTAEQRVEEVSEILNVKMDIKAIRALETVGTGQVHDRKIVPDKAVGFMHMYAYRPADRRDRELNPILFSKWCESKGRMLDYLEIDWDGNAVLPSIDEWDDVEE